MIPSRVASAAYEAMYAGNETQFQFNEEQQIAPWEKMKNDNISYPKLTVKGDNVSVSVRSKNKSAIVTVRGAPSSLHSHPCFGRFIRGCRENARLDTDNLDDEMGRPFSAAWEAEVLRAFPNVRVDHHFALLIANANACFTLALHTLIADLMMEAMEEEDNEGLRLCFANLAKLHHSHAVVTTETTQAFWGEGVVLKTIVM